jgi:PAS domain S-box-containing protein
MAHIGSWELDVATGEMERSAESYRIFGLAPEEYMITYEKFLDFVVPEDRERVVNAYRSSVISGEPYDVTFSIRRKDGKIRVLHSKAEPQKEASGRVVRLFGTNQDITERRRAEDALRESEEQLRLASQAAGIGVWSWKPGTSHVAVSANWRQLFGIPSDAKVTFETWTGSLHPEDQDRAVRELKEASEQHREFDAEYRVVHPDGSICWIVDRGHAWYDETGRAVGMAGVNVDITERKQSEERLKAATAQAELYLDLMGHDINNINQIALGYLEMARDMHADGDLKEFIDKPMEVLQRSTRLIGNVRKLQKLHEGALSASVVDLAGLLDDVRREFGSVPDKAVTLDLNGCNSCRVQANELLYDVFANLVTNALKHTGERADVRIGLEKLTEDSHHHCRVSVEDDGPGIPDEFKCRIFNRLLKGTDKAKGMGLGLYLVKSLVESYGGRVWVEDRVPGDHTKGAKFIVMLPAAE